MRIAVALILILMGCVGVSGAQETSGSEAATTGQSQEPWIVMINSNFGTWGSEKFGNSGNQALGFTQVAYDVKTWGIVLTGKYSKTSYNNTVLSESRFDVSTFADTDISDHYTYTSGDLTLSGGVDISLPTGKHGYSNQELGTIVSEPVSQDLMSLTSFGQGLNISPHLVIASKVSKDFTVGAGLKYMFSGEYDATTEIADDNTKPGDRLSLLLNSVFGATPDDYLMLTLSYSHAAKDKRQGQDVFHSGDIFSTDFKYLRRWSESYTSVLGLIVMTQQKNETLNESLVLASENQNSNNNSYELTLNNNYRLPGNLTFTGILGYKYVYANGYGAGDTLYDAGRWKAYIEPGAMWIITHNMYASVKLRYSQLSDKKDAFEAEDNSYKIYNFDFGLVYNFGL
jgi:hypothetical protein